MSQFFTSRGQSIEALQTSASALPMNIQGWFPLGLTGFISLLSKELSRVFSNTTVQKHKFFGTQLSLLSNSHIHTWLLEKIRAPRILFNSVSSLNSQWAFCFVSLLWKLKAVGLCALQKGIKQAFNGKGMYKCVCPFVSSIGDHIWATILILILSVFVSSVFPGNIEN